MMPLELASIPYTPTPSLKDSPVDPTSAKAVIVVPKMDIKRRNGPME
jgi:hypothetical protein